MRNRLVGQARTPKRAAMLEAQTDGTLSVPFIQSLFAGATGCPYCLAPLKSSDKSLDHITPVIAGGAHGIRNVLVCCKRCNSAKGALSFAEWLRRVSERHGVEALRAARRARDGARARKVENAPCF